VSRATSTKQARGAREFGAKLTRRHARAGRAAKLQASPGQPRRRHRLRRHAGHGALGSARCARAAATSWSACFGGELQHPLPPFAQRAIGIVGSYVGNLQELKEVVALAKKKKLKTMPVDDAAGGEVNAILEDLKAGRVLGRVVLDFESSAA
jgi:D-arabinose 1-dehydrogenase-like Zn-dependent alcohol dehydrogenase